MASRGETINEKEREKAFIEAVKKGEGKVFLERLQRESNPPQEQQRSVTREGRQTRAIESETTTRSVAPLIDFLAKTDFFEVLRKERDTPGAHKGKKPWEIKLEYQEYLSRLQSLYEELLPFKITIQSESLSSLSRKLLRQELVNIGECRYLIAELEEIPEKSASAKEKDNISKLKKSQIDSEKKILEILKNADEKLLRYFLNLVLTRHKPENVLYLFAMGKDQQFKHRLENFSKTALRKAFELGASVPIIEAWRQGLKDVPIFLTTTIKKRGELMGKDPITEEDEKEIKKLYDFILDVAEKLGITEIVHVHPAGEEQEEQFETEIEYISSINAQHILAAEGQIEFEGEDLEKALEKLRAKFERESQNKNFLKNIVGDRMLFSRDPIQTALQQVFKVIKNHYDNLLKREERSKDTTLYAKHLEEYKAVTCGLLLVKQEQIKNTNVRLSFYPSVRDIEKFLKKSGLSDIDPKKAIKALNTAVNGLDTSKAEAWLDFSDPQFIKFNKALESCKEELEIGTEYETKTRKEDEGQDHETRQKQTSSSKRKSK